MIRRFYTYNDYRKSKITNSLIRRFENLCDYLQSRFCMPTAIVGLHNTFKNKLSGQERDIAMVTPRLVLQFTGSTINRQAMTGIQAAVSMLSTSEDGTVQDNVLQYRRLPVDCKFNCQIVVDTPNDAIRLTEYLCLFALEVPQAPGDEFTISTLIVDENASIENKFEETNDYIISFGLTMNCQIPEPMTLPEDDSNSILAGVGVQLPDGSWDETPVGEIVYEKGEDGNTIQGPVYEIDPETGQWKLDEDGNRIPVLDEDGNQVIGDVPMADEDGNILNGNFVSDGWYRLHHRFWIHYHELTAHCSSDGNLQGYTDNAGFLEYGQQEVASFDCPEYWYRPAGALYWPNRKPNEYVTDKNEEMQVPPVTIPVEITGRTYAKFGTNDLTIDSDGESKIVDIISNTTWRIF